MTAEGPPPALKPANWLTVSRLAILPLVVIALVRGESVWVAGLILLAWGTDLVDGRLARRLGQAGQLGRSLDTIVDFALIFGLFIAFYVAGRLPTYQFVVLYFVKLGALALQFAWLRSPVLRDLPATPSRKLAGALGYAYLLVLMMRELAPEHTGLTSFQVVVFVILTLTMLLDAAECVVGRCRREGSHTDEK